MAGWFRKRLKIAETWGRRVWTRPWGIHPYTSYETMLSSFIRCFSVLCFDVLGLFLRGFRGQAKQGFPTLLCCVVLFCVCVVLCCVVLGK